MDIERKFYFHPRPFSVGELAACIAGLPSALGREGERHSLSLLEETADGSSVRREVDALGLQTVCTLANIVVSIAIGNDITKLVRCSFYDHFGKLLVVGVSAPESETILRVKEYVIRSLNIRIASAEERRDIDAETFPPSIWELTARIKRIEEIIDSPTRQLRCFLSYRFDPSSEDIALRVSKFLTLAGVEVITGANYEPRQISEKVLSRLRGPLDFIVLLLSSHGESAWTRDEIGAALHKNISIVPIVEEGANLAPGLFSDIEYITYTKSHIGDSFLKLLEAIAFVRAQTAGKRATAG